MSIPTVESTSPQQSSAEQQQQQAVPNTGAATQQPAQPVKRSSRRANTAERRATHNAVERARRETLNGRFLDLAAMLPNLAAVRRPSKSAIVNSSIALIHNTTRARILAARELRLLNAEANALRTELNEWRMRNSLPRVEEPVRSSDFATLLAVEDVEMGEEMVLGAGRRSFEEGFGDEDVDFNEEGDEEQLISPETAVPYGSFGQAAVRGGAPMQYPTPPQQQQQQQQLFEQQKVAMARAQQAQLAQQQAHRYSPPVIQQPQIHHQHTQSQPAMMFPADLYTSPTNDIYQATSWSQKAINSLTPPGSAHGQTKASPYANTANSAFLAGHQQQQAMFKPTSYNNTGFLSVSEDDQSDGSSHFSGVSDMGSLVEQPFSFGLSSNTPTPMNNGAFGIGMSMGYMGMMQLPPSPPHTGSSPASSQNQSRRPSVNIPSGGSAKSSPGPSPIPNPYGMPLMI